MVGEKTLDTEDILLKRTKKNMLSNILQGGAYLFLDGLTKSLGNGNPLIHNQGNACLFSGFGYHYFNTFFQPILENGFKLSSRTAKSISAGFVLTGCSLAEIVQSFNLEIIKNNPNWMGSVYDEKDFLAYAVGVGSALTFDLLMDYNRNRKFNQK